MEIWGYFVNLITQLMKSVFAVALFCVALSSCKKAVQNAQEDLVIKAMTDGQWRVTKFMRDGTDVTASFAPYKFQFRENNTVEAINNGAAETVGSWSANAEAKTIASNFSSGNGTVSLLNGTWIITRNSWTYVEATQTVNAELRSLRLDK